MRKKAMLKNLLMSIKRSIGRYIAILAIIALGAGLFVGLLASKNDIVATGQAFTEEQNMFDFRLLNTYGWTQTEVDALKAMDGVVDAEGLVVMDVVGYLVAENTDGTGYLGTKDMDNVFQLHQIPEDVNNVLLLRGRMPEKPNECLADGYYANEEILGAKFQVTDRSDADTLEQLNYTTFTVVGYVSTPLFMDMTRGNTSLGNGSIASYVYLPKEAFDFEYFTEIDITVSDDHKAYTSLYDDAIEVFSETLEPEIQKLADGRYASVYEEAMDAYNEGYLEYEDAVQELEDGKEELDQELADAYQELTDGERTIKDNEKDIKSAEKKLEQGKKEIKKNKNALNDAQKELDAAKELAYAELDNYEKTLTEQKTQAEEGLKAITDGLLQIEQGLQQLEPAITQMEEGLLQLQAQDAQLESAIGQATIERNAIKLQIEQLTTVENYDPAELEALNTALAQAEIALQTYTEQKAALAIAGEELQKNLATSKQQQETLLQQKSACEQQKAQLESGIAQLTAGLIQLEEQRKAADEEFAKLQKQLDDGFQELNKAQKTINSSEKQLKEGRDALEEAKLDLQEGWDAYYKGKLEAEAEIADAEEKLAEAEAELLDAKQQIDDLEPAELYMLDRSTNSGYVAVENNSNIVSGVSRVFPVFFLLVASLVCITTMTRMVEEERTQIGTLKALGYSNGAIISKYLIYAGSAAVLGCGVGVLVGSVIFPLIIWEGYKIILEMKPALEIVFDIPLCILVVLVYTAVILAVTWYCCRMSLRETPAELIRPKAPVAGKKILLEYLPFWEKISFLNKVMFRNIFRYKQRLLMMLVGTAGCTALLLTGFGMGDSVMDIVSYQYQEVTLYDIQAQFTEGLSQERIKEIREELGDSVDEMICLHQSRVDVHHNEGVKSLYLISADNSLDEYFVFQTGDTELTMPKQDEALISVGTASMLGIQAGDRITVRNADKESLEVTVSGVFDNHVFNYIVIPPQTIRENWGEEPRLQTALAKVPKNVDAHNVSAELAGMDDILSVMVCQDMADQVNSMLQGLNLIIATIVICAGLLAVIVLYNLTNINIKERIREISTIKVLGFRGGETAAYVFKENMLLTAVGALIGLGLGKLLLEFVMDQIKIDIVWMNARIQPESLLLSILITLLMAVLVDFFLYFRLEKINMAESLKSVE